MSLRKPFLFLAFVMLILNLVVLTKPELGKRTFAVESFFVGVYWDPQCTEEVASIDWGELMPGSARSVIIFLRNEVLDSSCFMSFWTENWNPPDADMYISVRWDYDNRNVELDKIVQVTMTIEVAPDIREVSNFDFRMIFFGTEHIMGDVDGDGFVNLLDLIKVWNAYGSTPSDAKWNPVADLNMNNVIDLHDMIMLCQNLGASSK